LRRGRRRQRGLRDRLGRYGWRDGCCRASRDGTCRCGG
jgi:hypothetical protein